MTTIANVIDGLRIALIGSITQAANFTEGVNPAVKYGVHEITLKSGSAKSNPFDTGATVTFTPPSGSVNAKTVKAFYDGENTWRARAYLNETGVWKWNSSCADDSQLDNRHGSFSASPSALKGMLRMHPSNGTAWITDNGEPFLHLSDTAYYLFNINPNRCAESDFQQYVAEDSALGITSVRSCALGGPTWINANNHNNDGWAAVDSNWPWEQSDSSKTRYWLEKFQKTDSRLQWMLNNYPDMYVQMILFGLVKWGADDNGVEWNKLPITVRENTMDYMIARWAAFPQIFWLVVNDMHNLPGNLEFAREVGRHFKKHDPWNHLLSSGFNRKAEFPDSLQEWATYIHVETEYDLAADCANLYKTSNKHVYNGEDRYEQDRSARNPLYPAYFYRRFFISWLLSNGSACYGGRFSKTDPYSTTGQRPYKARFESDTTYTARLAGLDCAAKLKSFLVDRKINLSLYTPDDSIVSHAGHPAKEGVNRLKCAKNPGYGYIIYDPNCTTQDGRVANANSARRPVIRINLSNDSGRYAAEWYRLADGTTQRGEDVTGGKTLELSCPWVEFDVLLCLAAKPLSNNKTETEEKKR